MALAAGTRIGHYDIVGPLGAGGMGEVYRAADRRLGRDVALKILPAAMASDPGRIERFQREARAVAALNHPHIVTIHSVEESGGVHFLTMELVDGTSLDRQIPPTGLAVDALMTMARQLATALAAAHEKGIVHRDLKPANVMVTETGRIKILDFGLAKVDASSTGQELETIAQTSEGVVLGTIPYMSPEQVEGLPLDTRSDIFSLGVMLHEMATGTRPFQGNSHAALVSSILRDVPVPVSESRPGIPGELGRLISRCLEKDRDERLQTARGLRDELHALERALARMPSLAATGTAAISRPPPTPATPLLGREEALESAVERLRSGARVLTITGPGGTGKTRFSVELFRRVQHDYPGGSAFVSLASVTAAEEVMPTVGVALDIAEAHGRSAVDAVATLIGDRRALLLLDNLEQVLDVAGDVATLVSRCPALHVVATSRAPLKIGAETELPLPPLALPAADATAVEEVLRAPAVALFVQRAAKVKPGFVVTAANASAVVAICRRLDGLPLALELAAARIRILQPAALLTRLAHALDLLTSGDRDLPERHRTLRATVDWSYSLLDEGEQRLLGRTSVFAEGWSFDAMEGVCYPEAQRHRAVDELDSLVEKGLVQVAGAGERYRLLETIREFAAERLDGSGEAESVREAHADFFLGFARDADGGIRGRGQLEWMRRTRGDNANTLSAIQWLTARARTGDSEALEKGLLLCGHLNWFWHIGGQHLTARGTVDALLALAAGRAPSRGRALALITGGMVSVNTGEMERALAEWSGAMEDALAIDDEATIAEAGLMVGYVSMLGGRINDARAALDGTIARSRAQGDEFLQAIAMTMKGMLHGTTGDIAGGMALIEQALEIEARIEDYEGGGVALSFLAQLSFAQGDRVQALDYYRQALHSLRTVGDHPEVARVHCEMGWTALALDQVSEARRSFREALRTYNEVGSPRGMGLALLGLAAAEAAQGRAERAVTIAAAAAVMSERTGVVIVHPMGPGAGDQIEALEATLPKATLDALVAHGRSLSPGAVLEMVAE